MGYITKAVQEDGLSFNVELQGHTFKVDADEQFGGQDRGPRPKALLLSALAGCTGMDVASILGKMKQDYTGFSLEIDAETGDEHPKVYTKIHIRYIFTGEGLDTKKIEKAIALSQDRYCGVSAMLGKTAEISTEVVLNP